MKHKLPEKIQPLLEVLLEDVQAERLEKAIEARVGARPAKERRPNWFGAGYTLAEKYNLQALLKRDP